MLDDITEYSDYFNDLSNLVDTIIEKLKSIPEAIGAYIK